MTTNNPTRGKILLVDDAPMNLKVLAAMIRKLGLESDSVPDGQSALDYIEKKPVSVVLTDLWMLEMNGAELAAKIHERHPEILVYAVTADAESNENPLFKSTHLKRILVKPVKLDTLKEILSGISC